MAFINMHSYDLIIQIRQEEFSERLAIDFARGALPTVEEGSVAVDSAQLDYRFLFGTPWIVFKGTDEIQMHLPFRYSYISRASGVVEIPDMAGETIIRDKIRIIADGNRRDIGLDFSHNEYVIEVLLAQATENAIRSADPALLPLVEQQIRDNIGAVLLGMGDQKLHSLDVDQGPNREALAPFELEALRILPSGESTCLTLLVTTRPKDSLNPDHFNVCYIPPLDRATVLISAPTILGTQIMPELAEAVGIPEIAFAWPCRLHNETKVTVQRIDNDGEIKEQEILYRELKAFVDGDHITIRGSFHVRDGGFGDIRDWGWRADVDFNIRIYFEQKDGALDIRIVQDDPDVQVYAAWYVWLGLLWLGPFILTIVGTTVAGIAVAITQRLLRGPLSKIFGAHLESSLAGVAPNSPEELSQFELREVLLNEHALILNGTIFRDHIMPVRAQSNQSFMATGTAIDLDTNNASFWNGGAIQTGIDLTWGSNGSSLVLKPRNGCAIGRLYGIGIRHATVLDVENGNLSPDHSIDINLLPSLKFSPLVFGARTSEGRYAICGVWRYGINLILMFRTWDRPVPSVSLKISSTILERKKVDSGTDTWFEVQCLFGLGMDGFGMENHIDLQEMSADFTINDISCRIRCIAEEILLAFPIASYKWTLANHVLNGPFGTTTAEGVVQVNNNTVRFTIDRERCTLDTELGTDIRAQLQVEVTDQRGLTVIASKWLTIRGTQKLGGMPPNAAQAAELEIGRCLAQSGGFPGGPGGFPGGPGGFPGGPDGFLGGPGKFPKGSGRFL